jgi:hypothetical protein
MSSEGRARGSREDEYPQVFSGAEQAAVDSSKQRLFSMNPFASWQFRAFGLAVFAALTGILAKVGIESVNSDFATLVRTIVILVAAGAMVLITNH